MGRSPNRQPRGWRERSHLARKYRALLWATQPHTCHLCGTPIHQMSDMHIDHLTPRSQGGNDWDITNMAMAHAQCNLRRGTKTIDTFTQPRKPSREW